MAERQQAVPPPEEEDNGEHRGVISPGATAGELLQEWLPAGEVASVLEACKGVFSFSNLRAGQPYTVLQDQEGFSRFEYEIDNYSKLVVCKLPEGYAATVERIPYEVVLEKVEGKIDSNLFATMADVGEAPSLAVRLSEIFAWEIDFIRALQPGDAFRLLVEKRYREGEFKGYGKILMAVFVNQGTVHEAYLYRDGSGNSAYFNAKGESLKRAFLKAPLSFTRISSHFTNKRLHPILRTWRAHPAVDYAAPTGTPVKAIGNGQVAFSGWGKGAGNYIALKHFGGYESMYLHLSAFAKGIKKGATVRQGQVIGYVGSTGYSTGPHLDFRMKKGGNYVNPEKTLSPKAEPVTQKDLARFTQDSEMWRAYMDGKKQLSDYVARFPEKDQGTTRQ